MTLIDSFIVDMEARRLAPDTIEIYARILRRFGEFMAARDRPPENATRQDFRAYLDLLRERRISRITASSYFGAISSFYSWLEFEEIIDKNPVSAVQKRYLQAYKAQIGHTHQMVSTEDAARLVENLVDVRDKALLMVLFTTGIRCKELVDLDVSDLNLESGRIILKPTHKRTNRVVFFTEEAGEYLGRWLKVRARRYPNEAALFVGGKGRFQRGGVSKVLQKNAVALGLHDKSSPNMEDHFSPHCCRHWFTTVLDRAGMKREHIQVLRGDVGKAAIDIYLHHDLEQIREEYLRCMPRLGV